MDGVEKGALIGTGVLAAVLVAAAAISGAGSPAPPVSPPSPPPSQPIGPTGNQIVSCSELCCDPGTLGRGPNGCTFSVNADGVCTCG